MPADLAVDPPHLSPFSIISVRSPFFAAVSDALRPAAPDPTTTTSNSVRFIAGLSCVVRTRDHASPLPVSAHSFRTYRYCTALKRRTCRIALPLLSQTTFTFIQSSVRPRGFHFRRFERLSVFAAVRFVSFLFVISPVSAVRFGGVFFSYTIWGEVGQILPASPQRSRTAGNCLTAGSRSSTRHQCHPSSRW